jgi:hypothetical protein
LKDLYKLYGVEANVAAKAWLQFGHNYNQVAREYMYGWFNKHLKLGQQEPISEHPFVPVPPKELSVYDKDHPLPPDAVDAKGLRAYMTKLSDRQLQSVMPADAQSLPKFRRLVGAALEAMVTDRLPRPDDVEVVDRDAGNELGNNVRMQTFVLSRKGQGEAVRALGMLPADCNGTGVIWVHPDGIASVMKDGKITPDAQKVLDGKAGLLCVEVFRTGAGASAPPAVNKNYAGYTFGYNRPLAAERVHDILTAVGFAQQHKDKITTIHLVGFGKAGPWVALARGLCGNAISRTAVDLNQFDFAHVNNMNDEMMLSGALKYGGVPTLAALAAPHQLLLYNAQGAGATASLEAAYQAAGQARSLRGVETPLSGAEVIAWLLR